MSTQSNPENLGLKAVIVALSSLVVGVALLVASKSIAERQDLAWLSFWPLSELGGILVGAGLLGVVWDYFDGKEREARDDARVRRLLKESAPDFRDAVVKGFAVEPDDLARVATPELLDGIATNTLALRLGDRQFAAEVYQDIRDQAIRAPERWHDVQARIRLSPAGESDTDGVARYIVTATWEYTVVPSHPTARFSCVSDKDEPYDLLSEVPVTTTWFMTPRPGFRAADRAAFELLSYSVDGDARPIRRSARKSGQTYTVRLGQEVVDAGAPVRVSYTYRTITPRSGHLLYFDIKQPTRNISMDFDYSDTDITHVSVLDLVASTRRARIDRTPADLPGKSVHIDFDGWVFPRTGFAFVWTLPESVALGSGVRGNDIAVEVDTAASRG